MKLLESWSLNDAKIDLDKCLQLEAEATHDLLRAETNTAAYTIADAVLVACKRRTRRALKRLENAVQEL